MKDLDMYEQDALRRDMKSLCEKYFGNYNVAFSLEVSDPNASRVRRFWRGIDQKRYSNLDFFVLIIMISVFEILASIFFGN